MKTNINIPKLRFPGFDGEWENHTMGSLYSFRVTNSFSRENLNYEDGKIKNIHYGDIHTKFQTLFNVAKESVPFINPEISIDRIAEENYCQEGDLILADASEDINDVGKSIELVKLNNEKVLSGLHTILARPAFKVLIIGFGGYLFKSNKVRTQIQKESQGSKVLSISSTRLSRISLAIPEKPEQQKIASFLTTVDSRLSQLKKQKALLEQYKKGVMQQIFSQQIYFKQDDGSDFKEWDWKHGNEIFESISNKNHCSDLPILAITQEQGAIPRDFIDFNISVTSKSIESYKVVEVGDFIISLRSFQGGIEYSNYKGICSPAYIILRPAIQIDEIFFKYYFKTPGYIKRLTKNLEGIRDGKMISYKYFSEVKLPCPSINEQAKIANFLSSIDKKINQCSSQIEKTELWKKGLLQQMFV